MPSRDHCSQPHARPVISRNSSLHVERGWGWRGKGASSQDIRIPGIAGRGRARARAGWAGTGLSEIRPRIYIDAYTRIERHSVCVCMCVWGEARRAIDTQIYGTSRRCASARLCHSGARRDSAYTAAQHRKSSLLYIYAVDFPLPRRLRASLQLSDRSHIGDSCHTRELQYASAYGYLYWIRTRATLMRTRRRGDQGRARVRLMYGCAPAVVHRDNTRRWNCLFCLLCGAAMIGQIDRQSV